MSLNEQFQSSQKASRWHQPILIAATLLGSWLAMQQVHELGHVLGALSTGGRVAKVVLHPLTISRTDVAHNPRPLLVVWAGPIIGIAIPQIAWAAAAAVKMPGAFVLRFFAGFCLIANGLYIGLGSFGRVGDCGEMLRHGSPVWLLWLFGIATVPLGFMLWNGQGPSFGLGSARGHVDRRVVYGSLTVCLLVLGIALLVGGQ
jgi:hypothetical protein